MRSLILCALMATSQLKWWDRLPRHVKHWRFLVTMCACIRRCLTKCDPIALFEPTSVPKSLKLFQHAETITAQAVKYTSPNQFELEAMCDTIRSNPILSEATKTQGGGMAAVMPFQLKSRIVKEGAMCMLEKMTAYRDYARCTQTGTSCITKRMLLISVYSKCDYKTRWGRLLVCQQECGRRILCSRVHSAKWDCECNGCWRLVTQMWWERIFKCCKLTSSHPVLSAP